MKPFSPLEVPLEGVSLVEASAGTGKTYAISTLFVRLLLERGLEVGQILVVTFTEAATAELRDRVRRRLQEAIAVSEVLERGDDAAQCDPTLVDLLRRQGHLGLARQNLRSALFQFDGAPIFTIHGFCQRVLRENAFATRVTFDAELMQDVRPLVEEVLTDYWLSALSRAPLSLIADLDKGGFTPQHKDLEMLSNFVAQATHLELKPGAAHTVPQVHEERVKRAFEEVKRHFDPPTIDTLLKPLYPRADHRAGRERDMRLYLNKPFGAEPLPERCKFFDPAEWKLKKGLTPPSHPFFDAVHRLRQAYVDLQAELDAYRLHLKQQLVAYLRREVANRKAKKGVLSFDDLLQQVYNALMGALGPRLSATLRGRYHAALIDEFQDTDPIQYGIFSTLFVRSAYSNDTALFLIGDPKQAIYSFRGADVFAYLTAVNAVAPDRRFTMGTNYRSDEQLVSAVNALFLRHPRPFVYDALTYPAVNAKHQGPSPLTPPGPSLDIRFVQRAPGATAPYPRFDVEKLLPERVAEHIIALLESGSELEGKPLRPSSIAILTRSNREAFDCQRALASRAVPSVVQGDRSVFEQPEAQELQLILAAVVEPSSASAVRTALATTLLGMSAEDINTLDTDEDAWDQWVERFRSYQERWREEGFVQMFHQLLLECGITQRLLSSHNGERRMTNVLHLSELLHTEAQEEHLGPSGLLQYLAEQRQRATTPTESEQVRLESDEDAVVLTTIHKSKGLEYPIVICPFLAGAYSFGTSKQWVSFHDETSREHVLDLGSEAFSDHTNLKLREDLSESLRLLYVALTRAKHRCVMYWGAFGDFHKSAMAELLYGPLDADASALKKADDTSLAAPLVELSRTQPGLSVTFESALVERPANAPAPALYERKAPPARSLNAQSVAQRVSHWHRTASFTELTRLAPSHAVGLPASDHDELTTDVAADLASSASDRTLLADFPGGATTGNFFHSILEEMDFGAEVSETEVERALANHGLPVSLAPLAVAGLRDTLTTPFHHGAALAHIPMSRRLSELAFTLPVTRVLTSKRLAAAFGAEPSEAVSEDYAQLIRELPFSALEGFLKGFVDLVFQHDGQWFVVDYKTNDLGDRYADYSPSELVHCMQHSHYILQYHLYSLALHRYLSLRLPDYDYDLHFGGVYYLFLRGMKPALGANNGVFFEKPPRRRLDLLSAALGETTP
jgi:exodeoxyribonuclease V beta subunit